MSVNEVMINYKYIRHEFHHEPIEAEGSLLVMIYDIPYFSACGIFPPFHIINQIFSSGGGDGGMSPGASWEPFQISKETYQQLVLLVRQTDPLGLKNHSRFYQTQFIEDPSFDSIKDRLEWMKLVCKKHRERYLKEISNQ